MKAQFLKIAGVKTDSEFYKLFPSEVSFFKKHPEAKKYIQTAQNGADVNGNGIPDLLESVSKYPKNILSQYGAGSQTLGKIPIDTNYNNTNATTPKYGSDIEPLNPRDLTKNSVLTGTMLPQQTFMHKATNTIPQAGAESFTGASSKIASKSSGMLDKVGGVGGIAEGVGGIIQGFQMLEEGRKERNKANQFNEYSKVALMASQTRPEEIKRRYNRPEDNIYSGDSFFPTNGVGTNVLAKNGKQLKNNKLKLITAEDGFELDAEDYSQIGSMGSSLYNNLAGSTNSGGSKIGGSVGKLAGTAIGGPIGGAIGEFAGTFIGDKLDSTGRDTKRFQEASEKNISSMMMGQSMQGLQRQNSSFMRNGGELSDLEESGELQTLWGGEAEQLSNNPYSGETIMFRGQAHSESDNNGNSGIGINYGNSPVEVERGEPATVLPNSKTGEENLVIFGNLKIPKFAHSILQDPKAHNKKFKNYVADLSKEETKLNKYIETSKTNIEALEGNNSFDKIELQSNNLKLQGAMMKLKDIANKKQSLSEFQNIINDTAEEHGFVADDLAKGKITRDKTKSSELRKAINGYEIPIARNGYNDPGKRVKNLSVANNLKNQERNKDGFFGKVTSSEFEDFKKKNTWYDFTNFDPKDVKDTEDFQNKFKKLAQEYNYDASYFKNDGLFGDQTRTAQGDFIMSTRPKSVATPRIGISAEDQAKIDAQKTTLNKSEANRPIVQYKKSPYIDAFNQVLPYIRPSNATELDGNQLLGEMYGMSSNQLEPVQSQNYRPELRTPYDISYQDQLNEITASERSAQKMSAYNPEAAAQIAAGAYQGKSKVLAEQFRANQAMKEGVYAQNTATLNDAQLKNLSLNDQQYTRQEQAKSNTKAINQALLNSISSKYSQNKLENRTLGIQENMYNYRFDKSGRAKNMNGIYQPNVDQSNYIFDKDGKATHKYVKDSNGKIVNLIPIDEADTTEDVTPIETSNKQYSFKPQEFEPLDLSMKTPDFNGNVKPFKFKNGGFISNSSLVKSLK